MYTFIGKKGRMYELKFNSNCKQEEKQGEGPGSCRGNKEKLLNNNTLTTEPYTENTIKDIYLNTNPIDINNTEAYKNIYNNMPIEPTDKNSDIFYDYLVESRDNFLKNLIKETKFDNLPTIVSPSDMDKILSNSKNIELYRGVPNKKYSDQFKHGEYVMGSGISGDGIYTTTNKKIALEYTYNKKGSDIMKLALSNNANIIEESKLMKERDIYINDLNNKFKNSDKKDYNKNSKEYRIILQMIQSPTVFAMIKGYDAIRSGNVINVLNRRALYVENK